MVQAGNLNPIHFFNSCIELNFIDLQASFSNCFTLVNLWLVLRVGTWFGYLHFLASHPSGVPYWKINNARGN